VALTAARMKRLVRGSDGARRAEVCPARFQPTALSSVSAALFRTQRPFRRPETLTYLVEARDA
jgi:hypothetical protein